MADKPTAGNAVDLARFGLVKTWQGALVKHSRDELQLPADIKQKNGVYTATSDGNPVNFGLEWNDLRDPKVVTVVYADKASAPEIDGQEMQVWLNPERIPAEGGETVWQGEWKSADNIPGYSVTVDGLKWTYKLPKIVSGVCKFRIVLKDKKTARFTAITATGKSKWRETEFEVRFDPPRLSAKNVVEGFNAEVLSVTSIDGSDGFKVKALASDAANDSEDRAIFTVRAENRSFSFLLNDLDNDKVIYVKPFGAKVFRLGVIEVESKEKTIIERVQAMPEQTYDNALKNIPTKQRNKFLSLSPPLNSNKFAIKPSGDIFTRDDWSLNYRFATGDNPDFKRIEPQHVENNWLPIIYANWKDGGLSWEQGYVSTSLGKFDDPTAATVLVTKITAKNEGSAPAVAKLWLCLEGGLNECVDAQLKDGVIREDKRVKALVDSGEWKIESDKKLLQFVVTIPAGETRSLEVKIPWSRSDRLPTDITFDSARKQTIDFWTTKLAGGANFSVPDERVNSIWKSLLIHQYCWGDYDEPTDTCIPNVAVFSYGPVGNESSQMAKALDFFGHAKMAQDYFKGMWQKQSADGSLPGWWGSYVFNTGFELWNLSNHYKLTGDRAWFDMITPNLIKACGWIIKERKTTIAKDSNGQPMLESGFFPPCGLEDEGRQYYWAMTNAYFYLGMRTFADVLTEINHPDAKRISSEADAYLKDIRRGIAESTVRCPVVKLQDGTYLPYIPKQLYSRGRSEGHYEAELGALQLLATNVYAPDSPQMDWTLDFLEDCVFLTEAPDHHSIISYQNLKTDWFNLGGYGKTQPYLLHAQVGYLRRDQPKLFLRAFWNQLVAQNFSDINAFPEHICWSGMADCKTYEEAMWLQQFRAMLVFDEDGALRLSAAAPREWFEDGKTISIKNAPTLFGNISYDIHSEVNSSKISAKVSLSSRKAPSKFTIRFRHPKELKMKRVTVDGKPWKNFDPAKEVINLPTDKGEVEVMAYY